MFWCEEKPFIRFVSYPLQASNFQQRPRWKIPRYLELRRIRSFNIEMKQYKRHYLEYRKVSIPVQGTKTKKNSTANVCTTREIFIETLIEKMKPVVIDDK